MSPIMHQWPARLFIPGAIVHRQNLLEKSSEKETRQEYALAMIQCKVLKQLENLEQQKYDDEDITEDIKFLLEKLGESVQDLRYHNLTDTLLYPKSGVNLVGTCWSFATVIWDFLATSRFRLDLGLTHK